MKHLMRDVGINVAANLIAAAIIYLVGVYAGVFPVSVVLTSAATLTIGAFAAGALIRSEGSVDLEVHLQYKIRSIYGALLIIPLTVVGSSLISNPDSRFAILRPNSWLSWSYVALSIVAYAGMTAMLLVFKRRLFRLRLAASSGDGRGSRHD